MSQSDKDQKVITTVENYKNEAFEAKRTRRDQNLKNYDFYHNRQDMSHKKKGQSREFLPKQSTAVEQITSFVHQSLVDLGEWFSGDIAQGVKDPLFTKDEMELIMNDQLKKSKYMKFVSDSVKSGLLGSLMIGKITGKKVMNEEFIAEGDKLKKRSKAVWQLAVELVRQEDYLPDPTGSNLYEIQVIRMDLWELKKIAKENPDVYDLDEINRMEASIFQERERARKARETGQEPAEHGFRKRIEIQECWGTILDPGTGEVMEANGVCAVAEGRFLIRKLTKNPFWHQKSPFVVSPILRVPHSVWHKALMDAPTELNQALNELYNLMLDGGLMTVWGVRQLRENWMDDPSQVNAGIAPGETIKVNTSCPPGQKVLERVDTSTESQFAVNMFNLTNQEFNTAAFTNDLRLGALPARQVKATEVVEASNSITSVFAGIVKVIEEDYIQQSLNKAWAVMMQHIGEMDALEGVALVGEERFQQLNAVSAKERFARSLQGHQFKVFGLTQTLNRIKDFQKLVTMMQTVSQNPILMEEFAKEFSFSKLLKQIMLALNIDSDRIKLDETERAMNMLGAEQGAAVEGGADLQSQVPSAAANQGSDISEIPRDQFARPGGQ